MDPLLSQDGNTENWQAAMLFCVYSLESMIRQGLLPIYLLIKRKELLLQVMNGENPLEAIDLMTAIATQIEALSPTSKQVLALVHRLRNF